MIRKEFKLDDESFERYNNFKKIENLTSDSEFFRKMLDYTEIIQSKQLVPIELLKEKDNILKEKDEKLTKMAFELGKLQGELNIYKQQALPKKSFWKRLFGG